MTNELFIKVTELDEAINTAYEAGDTELEETLYEQQETLIREIESKGLRDEFDHYIEGLN